MCVCVCVCVWFHGTTGFMQSLYDNHLPDECPIKMAWNLRLQISTMLLNIYKN